LSETRPRTGPRETENYGIVIYVMNTNVCVLTGWAQMPALAERWHLQSTQNSAISLLNNAH